MSAHLDALAPARDLCAFVAASPSPYHVVIESIRRLEAAGFKPLQEADAWHFSPGARRYVVRADTSLIAFRVGTEAPARSGFNIIGAHTDSPNLRLKPRPVLGKEGYTQLAVEIYGGVLLHTWIDRDLGLAGRVLMERPDGSLSRCLVNIHEPLARVASLAIHLDREVNDKGAIYNRQTQMAPLLGLGDADTAHGRLKARLAQLCDGPADAIRGFDLGLYDLTPPSLGGMSEEFVFAARLDNQASCHAALEAITAENDGTPSTQVIALFDHEEVGSASAQGAGGSFLKDVLGRIVASVSAQAGDNAPSAFQRAIAHSFCISADMAHAVHPNFSDKHEPRHMPRLGEGPVVKNNVQQRYATDGYSAARFRQLCRRAGVLCQDFVTRTDLACGSTIGPITATELGIATVDVGNPMLSMHSTRELCGSEDVGRMIRVMRQFLGSLQD